MELKHYLQNVCACIAADKHFYWITPHLQQGNFKVNHMFNAPQNLGRLPKMHSRKQRVSACMVLYPKDLLKVPQQTGTTIPQVALDFTHFVSEACS